MKPNKNQREVSANEELRESCGENELNEGVLTAVHGGVDLVRPEVMQEGERIAQDIAKHHGENPAARAVKSTGYAVVGLVAYNVSKTLTEKKS